MFHQTWIETMAYPIPATLSVALGLGSRCRHYVALLTCVGSNKVRESSCSGENIRFGVGKLCLSSWLCDLGEVLLLL